ncbi:hypothetical protein JCM33374_g3238 [Metschnikowia sp. JCM 33374]|nr:hypothetical protein JCM33374_g3238 [Metschnikowia sp. JCM 33374]
MFSHNKDQAKDLTYFDIRLKTHGFKNTVLVKGNEAEVENVPLEGHIKLSTKSDLHVKKIRLVLTGEQSVDYYNKSLDGGQVSERNCVLRVVWPNLLCSAKGDLHYGDYSDTTIKYQKADSLAKRSHDTSASDLASLNSQKSGSPKPELSKRPTFHKTKSQPILFKNQESSLIRIPRAGIDGTPCPEYAGAKGEGHSFLLPNGNYSMPFFIHLPANTPESVEGLSIGKIRYKLECHIERGRFDRPFKKACHFRIIRTLHSRNMNLYDSIDFTNTWPGKIDFNVSVPRKGIALGTSVPIKLVIVPLIKGLSFKSMYAEIVQHSFVSGLWGRSPGFEHVIGKSKLSCPNRSITDDHWVIQGSYQLPSSLSEITPTCSLKNDLLSVKHRVRVQIHIRNADGHVSELRANLPVVLYISPNHGRVVAKHLEIDATGHFVTGANPGKEDSVFPVREPVKSPSETAETEPDNAEPEEEDDEDSAPPIYTQHTKDMVYDYTSARSPMEQLRASSGGMTPIDGYFDLPVNKSKASSPMPDLTTLSKIPCYEEALEEDSDEDGEEPAPSYSGDSSFSKSPTPVSRTTLPRPSLAERSSSMSNLLTKDRSSPAKKKHLFLRKEKK